MEQMGRVFRRVLGLLWVEHGRSTRDTVRAGVLTILAVAALGSIIIPSPKPPQYFPNDLHAAISFEMAINRVICGRQGLGSQKYSLQQFIRTEAGAERIKLKELPLVLTAGDAKTYCDSVRWPFLNNENTLMYLFAGAIMALPDGDLTDIGTVFRILRF